MKQLLVILILCLWAVPVWCNDWTVPFYSQRTCNGNQDHLGTCTTETIYSDGCAMCSTNMVYNFWGIDELPDGNNFAPSLFNIYLRDHGGYILDCQMDWPYLNRDTWLNQIRYVPGYLDLRRELRYGPVIGKMQTSTGYHFFVITGDLRDSGYPVNDPWGTEDHPITTRSANCIMEIRILHGPIRMADDGDIQSTPYLDPRNCFSAGRIGANTPIVFKFTVKNYNDHSVTLDHLVVSLHRNDTNSTQIADFHDYTDVTLTACGTNNDHFTYWNLPQKQDEGESTWEHNPDFILYTLNYLTAEDGTRGNQYVLRAKYEIDGVWYDIPPHDVTGNNVVLRAVPDSLSFTDLPADHTLNGPIAALWQLPVDGEVTGNTFSHFCINGIDETHFSPQAAITRGQICLMIVRAKGLTWDDSYDDFLFNDVTNTGSQYYQAIYICKHFGYVEGQGGYFYPDNPLTRGQACKIVALAFEFASENHCAYFKDICPSNPISIFANKLRVLGIMQGYPDGRLGENNSLTRAEACKVFLNSLITKNSVCN